jgi:hypothetical protein
MNKAKIFLLGFLLCFTLGLVVVCTRNIYMITNADIPDPEAQAESGRLFLVYGLADSAAFGCSFGIGSQIILEFKKKPEAKT